MYWSTKPRFAVFTAVEVRLPPGETLATGSCPVIDSVKRPSSIAFGLAALPLPESPGTCRPMLKNRVQIGSEGSSGPNKPCAGSNARPAVAARLNTIAAGTARFI